MSDEEKKVIPKIKKLLINKKAYVDLNALQENIGQLAVSMILNGRMVDAMCLNALLHVLDKDDLYDTYPKKDDQGEVAEGNNLINLFGDNS